MFLSSATNIKPYNYPDLTNNQLYLDEPSKSKVSYFDYITISNQNISGSQVPVDVVLRFEVGHA